MCKIAVELGYCLEGVENATKRARPWCNNFNQQETCGKLRNIEVSNGYMHKSQSNDVQKTPFLLKESGVVISPKIHTRSSERPTEDKIT